MALTSEHTNTIAAAMEAMRLARDAREKAKTTPVGPFSTKASGRAPRRTKSEMAAVRAAAEAVRKSGVKVGARGQRSSAEQKAIAAAERVVAEIKLAVEEMTAGTFPLHLVTTSFASSLPSMTRAGYRSLIYHKGQELIWTGELRASTKGELLFAFEPIPNASHPFITERGVTRVEITHVELDTVIDGFRDWIVENFGSSPEDFLSQAAAQITSAELLAANLKKDEEEAVAPLDQVIPNWGAWA